MGDAERHQKAWDVLFSDPEISKLFSDDAIIAGILAFERAWTEGLFAAGQISADAQDAAFRAIDEFQPDRAAIAGALIKDGLQVPEIVRQLRASLSPDDRQAIHTGATSQDVLDTVVMGIMRDVIGVLAARLDALCKTIDALDAAHGAKSLMARTRMQAALPATVALRLSAWRAPLAGLRADAATLSDSIRVLQAGGPVGLGGFDPKLTQTVADRLGVSVAPIWHTDRRRIADLGHWLAKVSGACGKIGADISLMAQQGIDDIRLRGGGGSSAMPHKANPVAAEIAVALGRSVAGQQGILAQCLIHEQERSGAAWALEWMHLPMMSEQTGAALLAVDRLLGQITDIGHPA